MEKETNTYEINANFGSGKVEMTFHDENGDWVGMVLGINDARGFSKDLAETVADRRIDKVEEKRGFWKRLRRG